MTLIEETIDVSVPLYTAYDQWTQFEDFPRFMEGVDQVQQLNETTLEWRATAGGIERVWQARIVEQVPDQRITWISTEGTRNDVTVSFGALGGDRTRVSLLLDVDPDGPIEDLGAAMGILRRRVRADLARFRDFIVARGTETGAWRGEVPTGSEGEAVDDDDVLEQGDTRSPNPGWSVPLRSAEPAGSAARAPRSRPAGNVDRSTPEDVPGLRSTGLRQP